MDKNIHDYAVVVGVSHYDGLTMLNGPAKDAEEFKNWLIDTKGGNIPEENCHLVLSTESPLLPIQDHIDQLFKKIFMILKYDDFGGRRLYFYFSGHGLGIEWRDTALVLPPWSDMMRNYALSSSEYLKAIIESGYFKEVFFFLDCCRNRMIGVRGANPLFGSVKPGEGTPKCVSYGFSATEFDNKAFEAVIQPGNGSLLDNDRTRGLFTVALINGLKGAAAINGRITTRTLMDYLHLHLPLMALEHKKTQIPRFHIDSDIIETTILEGLPTQSIELNIQFREKARKVILEDSNLNTIKNDSTDTGPWKIAVKKGLYAIRYAEDELSTTSIRIDGTLNEVHYEY